VSGSEEPIDPIALANRSGYPLQTALAQLARRWEAATRWYVLRTELPWTHPRSGEMRFVDLVLGSTQTDEWNGVPYSNRMGVECKRVDGTWLFPVSKNEVEISAEMRILYRDRTGAPPIYMENLYAGPKAHKSEFCVMSVRRGKAFDGDRRTLEPWASDLVLCGRAVLELEVQAIRERESLAGILYTPVIVTTAALCVLIFDPAAVDLTTGHVEAPPGSTIEDVEWVRFSKDLGHDPGEPRPLLPRDPRLWPRQDVWIVRASSFEKFLKSSGSVRVRNIS
jgi:hypothetical protein